MRPASTTRRSLTFGVILVAGWTAAAVIYATARPVEEDPELSELFQSKRYRRQLEMIGGKASLLAADLEDWFGGLWQGQNLAYTTAVLTAAAALGYRFWPRAEDPPGGPAAR